MSSFTSLIHCFVEVTKLSSRFTLANLIVIGFNLRILNISIPIPLGSWDCYIHRNDIKLTAFFTSLFFAFDKFSISFCKCFVIWYKSDYCCLTHLCSIVITVPFSFMVESRFSFFHIFIVKTVVNLLYHLIALTI